MARAAIACAMLPAPIEPMEKLWLGDMGAAFWFMNGWVLVVEVGQMSDASGHATAGRRRGG
jgi:hypothetical protein